MNTESGISHVGSLACGPVAPSLGTTTPSPLAVNPLPSRPKALAAGVETQENTCSSDSRF